MPSKTAIIPLPGSSEKLPSARAQELCPEGITLEERAEFMRVAIMLAQPELDRLKPHYVDVILEYARAKIALKDWRRFFEENPKFFETHSKASGVQIKAHPGVAQMNETLRQFRGFAAVLGLSPNADRNLAPGQGQDDGDGQFA